MSIQPILHSVDVKSSPQKAFDLFTARMGAWWPSGRTPAKHPHVAIIVEPRQGGRWFERDSTGNEEQWGTVLAWEPPRRLLLGWQLNQDFKYDPKLVTEVELIFEPLPGSGTRVTLEHRHLERFGAGAEIVAGKIRNGWPGMLGLFSQYADRQT